jgi:serine/threonine protein kinase
LEAVHHPFIVGLAYAFQTQQKLYMVMDFVQGGDFFTYLRREGRLPEERVQLYVAEIALALHHLHSLNVVYRDLKPENVLLDHEGHVKLTDFGLSRYFETRPASVPQDVDMASAAAGGNGGGPPPGQQPGERNRALSQVTHSFCGTEHYMAPEMLLQQGHGKPVDWWCLGILACEMLQGRHPFDGGNHYQTLRNMVGAASTSQTRAYMATVQRV